MKLDSEKLKRSVKNHRFPYLILTALIVFNIPVLIDLISDWMRDGNYSHGFFIIPISVYLYWKKRDVLTFPSKSSGTGFVFFIVGLVLLILGTAASEFFTTRFGLVLSVTGLAWYYLGNGNFRKVWFPFFFLIFMIPIPAIIYYAATLPCSCLPRK